MTVERAQSFRPKGAAGCHAGLLSEAEKRAGVLAQAFKSLKRIMRGLLHRHFIRCST